jgi:hypothetical protein
MVFRETSSLCQPTRKTTHASSKTTFNPNSNDVTRVVLLTEPIWPALVYSILCLIITVQSQQAGAKKS